MLIAVKNHFRDFIPRFWHLTHISESYLHNVVMVKFMRLILLLQVPFIPFHR